MIILFLLFRLLNGLTGQAVSANIKRETKAYSYEDQVWDVKMKQKLSEKKLQELEDKDIHDLIKESSLTQRQCDTITSELRMESNIREKVNKLKEEVKSVHLLFTRLVKLGGVVLPHLHKMLTPLMTSINSVLTQQVCVQMWLDISHVIFPERKTGLYNQLLYMYMYRSFSTSLLMD